MGGAAGFYKSNGVYEDFVGGGLVNILRASTEEARMFDMALSKGLSKEFRPEQHPCIKEHNFFRKN